MSNSPDEWSAAYGVATIVPEHKPLFETYLSTCRTRLSDYTFANTFIWRDSINLRWRVIRDCLCIFANGDSGLSLLLPPTGPGDVAAAAREALEICDQYIADHGHNEAARIEYVSDEMLARLGGGFDAAAMSGDYVYHTRKMIDLDGSDLASKRHARNRFIREHAPRVEPFGPEHLGGCIDLIRTWDRQAHEQPTTDLSVAFKRTKDELATIEAMRCHDVLGLRGLVVFVNDRIVGFTLGERLADGETCSILIEKTDRQYTGSAQFIFSEFCRTTWADTQWCNVGDDWDIPSLAWTKQSYRPAYRLAKWTVHRAAVRAASVVVPEMPRAFAEPMPVESPMAAAEAVLSEGLSPCQLDLAGRGDLDYLLAIEAQCFASGDAFTRRQLRYLLGSPRASVHVIRQAGEIVGEAILLRRRHNGHGLIGRLYSMAVAAAHRGKGHGKTLLKNCLDVLDAEGISTVYLEVEATNTTAIGLYQSFGFVRVRRLRDYYGPGRDGWKMCRKVSAEHSLPEMDMPRQDALLDGPGDAHREERIATNGSSVELDAANLDAVVS